MKKIALSILVAVAAFFCGTNAKAQIAVNFTTDPIAPEYAALAQQVIDKQTTDPDGANKIFSKLLKKVAKDKAQATAVGKFFLDHNVYPCAKQCAAAAYKCDVAYEPGLLLGVGVHLLRKQYGEAGAKLDEILAVNPANLEAKRLSARVYKYVNPYAAKSILAELEALDPDYEDIQKQIGDVAYMLEDYKACVAAYAKYFAKTPNPGIMDLLSGENYLIALMNQGDFYTMKEVIPVLEPLIDRDVDIVIPRMKFIAQMETMDYQGAAQTVEYVASGRFNDSVYVDFDYLYGATYFREVAEDNAKALELQLKRLDLPGNKDKNIQNANKEIANLYRRLGNATQGLPYYEKYVEMLGEGADVADKLLLGNYYAAVKDEKATVEEKMEIIQKADHYFQEYMDLLPNKYQGPYYRAMLWLLDKNKPNEEALVWFDKVVEVVKGLPAEEQEAAQKYVVTAYTYRLMQAYGAEPQDMAAMKKYTQLLLEVDPANSLANQFKAALGL